GGQRDRSGNGVTLVDLEPLAVVSGQGGDPLGRFRPGAADGIRLGLVAGVDGHRFRQRVVVDGHADGPGAPGRPARIVRVTGPAFDVGRGLHEAERHRQAQLEGPADLDAVGLGLAATVALVDVEVARQPEAKYVQLFKTGQVIVREVGLRIGQESVVALLVHDLAEAEGQPRAQRVRRAAGLDAVLVVVQLLAQRARVAVAERRVYRVVVEAQLQRAQSGAQVAFDGRLVTEQRVRPVIGQAAGLAV